MATIKVIGMFPEELHQVLERAGYDIVTFPDVLEVDAGDVEGLSPVVLGDVGRYAARGLVKGLARDAQATQRFFLNDPMAASGGSDSSEQELRALIEFSQAVTRSLAKAEIVDAAVRYLQQQCAAPAVAVFAWSAEHGLEPARASGLSRAELRSLETFLQPHLRRDELTFRQGIDFERHGVEPAPVELSALVPVLAKDVLLGVLAVRLNPHFPLSFPVLRAMGRQLALSLHNGELLAQAEAALSSLRRAQDSLGTSEKLAAVGLLAAGIAHEINNPTAFIITNLTVLGDNLRDVLAYADEVEQAWVEGNPISAPKQRAHKREHYEIDYLSQDMPELIARCLKGMHRIQDIVRDLKSFAHKGGGREEWVDVNQLISQVLKLAGAELRHRADVELDLRPLPRLWLESTKLTQVLLNLIINAYQAFGERAKSDNMVWVGSSRHDGSVQIYVQDNGPGMTDDVKGRVFEPFFTTKPVGTGSGLGLAVSYELVKKMGGRIVCESTLGRGTRFSVELPVQPAGEPGEAIDS